MSAFKIFSRFAELLDIKTTRAAAAWLRLNADGTVTERTSAEMRVDLGYISAVQENNQEISNQNTFVDATGLFITLDPGDYYISSLVKISAATTTPGVWEAIVFSGSISMDGVLRNSSRVGGTGNDYFSWNGAGLITASTTAVFTRHGIVRVSVGGSLKVQFRQNTSSADTVTLLAGSMLSARRVA